MLTQIQEYQKNKEFIAHCVVANVKPTRTQASKFLRGKGAAYLICIKKRVIHIAPHARHHDEDGKVL